MRVPLGVATAAMLALLAATPAHAQRTLGSLRFTPCTLSAGVMPDGVDAQCTTMTVPEDRAKAEGRQLTLAISWVPSDTPQAAPDPVFMLAGGPGQAAREAYPMVSGAFRRVLRNRHVILVDQRGTGDSAPMVCRDAEGKSSVGDEALGETPEAFAAFARRCAEGLDADPRFYTTSDAIDDLEAVRQAIGAEQIDLVGISYGTRVAQEYLRRHPDHTRAVVLDGVVPPALILGSEHAKNLERSLDAQFARCQSTPACAEKFGAPRERLDALFAQLRAAPVPVTYRDPLTGERKTEDFTASHLAGLVRLFSYDPRIGAILPQALALASAGDFETLMMQTHLVVDMMETQIAHGMQLSVMCAEDVPWLEADPADENTVLGNVLVTVSQAQCAAWPRGRVPDDFHAPVSSDKPVLITSGEFDPVTPPRYGDEVLKTLKNGRHLVARGRGHNVIGVGCMPRVLAEFLREPEKDLDAKCLDQLDYIPPFAGFYGSEP